MEEKGYNTKIAMLFDLDGVLIDSEKSYSVFWSEIGRRFPTGYDNLSTRIKGMTLTEIYHQYFPDPEIQNVITSSLNRYESEMVYNLNPGVADLLEDLKSRNIPAVMVTSSNDKKMKSLWRQHPELKDYFLHIVTADQISHSKPDPEGYLLGAKIAGADIHHCAVFEDSAQGVAAGHNSGAFVIGIAGTLPADVIQPFSDIVIDSLENFNSDHLISILTSR